MVKTDERNCSYLDKVSYVYMKSSDVPKDILNKIASNDNVDKVIRCMNHSTFLSGIIGIDMHVDLFEMNVEDIKYLCDALGYHINGDINYNASFPSVALNSELMKNKGLKLNDYIGNKVQSYEILKGKYKITASITGDSTLSFIPADLIKNYDKNFEYSYVVIPKRGQLNKVNEFLKSLKEKDFRVIDKEYVTSSNAANNQSFDNVFNIFIIVNIIVLAVSLGNSTYVHYFRRRKEYGILKAIGYSNNDIILRIFKEVIMCIFLGFTIGILFQLVFEFFFNIFYMLPHGLPKVYMDMYVFPKLISIPLFICVTSLIPVLNLIKKIDAITIIEKVG
jgi:ABC-type antimicrobial peptide transport system, permease component